MTLLQKLRDHRRLDLSLLLAAMSVFCFALSITRYYMTDSRLFLFLNWNLFLAFIPWLASTAIILHPDYKGQKVLTVMLLLVWIVFFPNSPYILTDLFHLRISTAAPVWFDLTLILSFAWTGLMYGFVSLMDIENLMENYFQKRFISFVTTLLLFVAGFGIYLGRYLRWNSWDILSDPSGLFQDIGSRFTDPMSHPRTWGMTILMGLLLNIMYWSMKLWRGQNYASQGITA